GCGVTGVVAVGQANVGRQRNESNVRRRGRLPNFRGELGNVCTAATYARERLRAPCDCSRRCLSMDFVRSSKAAAPQAADRAPATQLLIAGPLGHGVGLVAE